MIQAIIFDKDGTLFDFQATWGHWAGQVLEELSDGDAALLDRLAGVLRYDLETRRLMPDSIAIAGTPVEIANTLGPHLPGRSGPDFLHRLNALAELAPQVEVTPLGPFIKDLKARDLKLAVMTNDAEIPAKAHLNPYISDLDVVVGSDSGFGAKPDPDPLLAIAHILDVDPRNTFMVGDSTHDLRAGRAAGMKTIGVLTGPAERQDLAPFADFVLPNVTGIFSILEAQPCNLEV